MRLLFGLWMFVVFSMVLRFVFVVLGLMIPWPYFRRPLRRVGLLGVIVNP